MPDSKITALTSIGTSTDPANDPLVLVDVSDTSMAATGTTKKVTLNQLLATSPTATLASATITGDLTVDTTTLKVDSANDKVGFGTTSPFTRADSLSSRNTALGSIAAFNTMPLSVTDDTAFAVGVGGGLNFRAKLTSSTYSTYAGIWSYRESALNSDYAGSLIFGTSDNSNGYPIERFRISSSGVATWSVGGSTAMTLNSTGLGVGQSPTAKLDVLGNPSTAANNTITGALTKFRDIYTRFRSNSAGISGDLYAAQLFSGGDAAFEIYSMTSYPLVFGTNATEVGRFDASGNLLVGRTTQPYAIGNARSVFSYTGTGFYGAAFSNSTSGNGTAVIFTNSTGGLAGFIDTSNTTVTYGSVSDYRLKENVQPLTGCLARVNALKPSIYKWKSDGSAGEGFLAHELAEVVPFAVSGEKDAVSEDGSIKAQGVDLSKVVPVLVAAIQELTARVQTLEAK
jgi:hypothetical protein